MNRLGKLALLGLTACGYSSYWPQAGPFGTGDTGTIAPQIPCGVFSGNPVELTLVNQLPETLSVWQMEPSTCTELYVGDLGPNAFGIWPTASGLVWFTRTTDGVTLRWFEVPGGVSDWTEQVP
jgi:hypothetical protein